MAPAQKKMCNGSGGRRPHLADVSEFGTWGGRVMKSCRACAAKNSGRKKKGHKKVAAARAAKLRAAADASPDVFDVERSRYERRLIAREILSHEVFQQLSAEATVMIFGTSRFPVGEASLTIVKEEMWKEAVLSFSRRGYGYPSLLHDDGTCIGEVELKRAGAQMELLYLSDRITDATGNVESGEGAVEGHLIRMIENALGCTDAMRAITHYKACCETRGGLLNKSATARGSFPVAGMWGAVGALVIPAGWASQPSWHLMNGPHVHLTPSQAQAARSGGSSATAGSGSLFALQPPAPMPSPSISKNGDAWRKRGESNVAFLARAVENQRAWRQQLQPQLVARLGGGSSSFAGSSFAGRAEDDDDDDDGRADEDDDGRADDDDDDDDDGFAGSSFAGRAEDDDDDGRADEDDDGRADDDDDDDDDGFAGSSFAGRAEDDDDDGRAGDGGGMLSGMPPPFAGYPGFDLYMGGSGGGGSGGGGSGSRGGGSGGGSGSGGMPPPLPPPPSRPLCWYGAACYQKSPWHKAQFQHPAAPDATAASARATTPPPRGAISEPPRSASPVQGGGKKARAR
jgi:uncharacterized membrane protein YgcG